MAEKNENRTSEPFRLFSSSASNVNSGFGFLDSPEPPTPTPPPPPPPSVEVFSSEASSSVKYTVEPVNLNGLTLLKGRVSTQEVFALSNSDLVPGKYEGGLKLWEGSLDLVKALRSEVGNEHLTFTGKRVLELGCGHGLPGIFACLEGAGTVHFQDFNAEVLKCLTIPNVNANLQKKLQNSKTDVTNSEAVTEVRFFAGDWSEIDKLLPYVRDSKKEINYSTGNCSVDGYDIILMAETVYSVTVFQRLYELIKKCMSSPHGLVYMAAKKHYFGVGGGTRQFLSMVEKDGLMAYSLVAEVTDGSSNVREVWKLSYKNPFVCRFNPPRRFITMATTNNAPEINDPPTKLPKLHENGVHQLSQRNASFFRVKKLSENAVIPTRGSPLSAGYDLSSATDTKVPARGKALVPTDLSIAVPEGTYARIAPRSGLAWKHSIDVGAGVIDADYRGPVGVILFNYSDVDFEVKLGDRVAQLIIEKIITPDVMEVEDLDATIRGSGGFGSTGV